jgi:hypothetical protein
MVAPFAIRRVENLRLETCTAYRIIGYYRRIQANIVAVVFVAEVFSDNIMRGEAAYKRQPFILGKIAVKGVAVEHLAI